MPVIPIPEEKQWTQPNTSELFGNLYGTRNIDFAYEGFLSLAPRTRYITREASLTSTLKEVLAIVYGSFDNLAEKYWIVGANAIHTVSEDLQTVAIDAISGTPTTSLSASDGVFWNDGLWVSTGAGLYTLATGTWTNNTSTMTISQGVPHPLCVGWNNLLMVGNGNTVNSRSTSGTVTNAHITIPDFFQIQWIRSFNKNVWIGTRNISNGNAKVFQWDGSSSFFNNDYEVDASWIYSGVNYKGNLYIFTNDGRLMSFNGAGFQNASILPMYTQKIINNSYFPIETVPNRGSVFNRGMEVIEGKIHIALSVEAQLSNTTQYALPEMSSGIWVFDENIGLTHKYAPSNSSAETDFGALSVIDCMGAISPIVTSDPDAADGGTLLYGAQVSGDTASQGLQVIAAEAPALEFDTADAQYNSTVLFNTNHVLNVWQGPASDGFAQIFRIDHDLSMTAIGTALEYDTVSSNFNTVIMLDATHAVVMWVNSTAPATYAQVLAIDASTYAVTAVGSPFSVQAVAPSARHALVKLDATHVMVAYQDASGDGQARILTVSGAYALSFAAAATEFAPADYNWGEMLLSSDPFQVLIAYETAANAAAAQFLTFDGAWNITAGPVFTYDSGICISPKMSTVDATHVLLCYSGGGSAKAQVLALNLGTSSVTTAGTILTFDTTFGEGVIAPLSGDDFAVAYNGNPTGSIQVLRVDTGTFNVSLIASEVTFGGNAQNVGGCRVSDETFVLTWSDSSAGSDGFTTGFMVRDIDLGYYTLGSVTSGENRGTVMTSRLSSDEMQDNWEYLWIKFEELSANDKIVVKYRTQYRAGYPISDDEQSAGSYTSSTVFVASENIYDGALVGDEITIMNGPGAGTTVQISAIDTATNTITFDEAVTSVVATNQANLLLDNFQKIDVITATDVNPGVYPRYAKIPIPKGTDIAPQPSEWLQLKLELRGEQIRISNMYLLSKTRTKTIF